MSEEESNQYTLGTELDGDPPADAEVIEGQKPSDPEPEADVEGRQDHGHGHGYFRYATCPYHDCHASNRCGRYVHYVHCWRCHRNFHV